MTGATALGPEQDERVVVGKIVLVRHGATAWSAAGRHTGRSDIALDNEGREQAFLLQERLRAYEIGLVLSSPLRRARETAELAGFIEVAQILDDLCEWDYGDYEGVTTAEIHRSRPDWDLFRDGCPGGESLQDVVIRAMRVIEGLSISPSSDQCAVVFAHSHLLRVLASCYLQSTGELARHLILSPAAISVLAYERTERVIRHWNA